MRAAINKENWENELSIKWYNPPSQLLVWKELLIAFLFGQRPPNTLKTHTKLQF